MKKFLSITGILLFLLVPKLKANNNEVSFTLQDRDRIIQTEQKIVQTEQKVDFLKTEMNARFESADKRFDQLFNFLWAIIGIFTSMFIAMLGFAFWDRKLSVAPIKRDNDKLLTVLRDYAKHQPRLSEILRNAGLL
jgi:hypothetical protein